MSRIAWWCAGLLGWYFVLFNIERLHAPLNLASFVYVLAALLGLALVLIRPLLRLGWPLLVLMPLPLLLILKAALGYPIGQSALPITVTEYCALAISAGIAAGLAMQLKRCRAALFNMLASDLADRSQPFQDGQATLYREVRRARVFERPLTLVALEVDPAAAEATHAQLRQEVTDRMVREYLRARLADLLSRHLKDCDVIAQRNGHFIAALPETNQEEAQHIVRQLAALAHERGVLKVRIGISSFPDEEVTFVKLLELAEDRMTGKQAASKPEPASPVNLNDTISMSDDDSVRDLDAAEFFSHVRPR